ncbi:hypothetical protein J437_LFUL014530 [Ladona fulva]|uniref:Uncharacterized protein n=1 Tax=Ladona fulva TaxID=123851 RepID=A0A8K0KG52_LADFU|nr:hypothetical protein J437_LFUL014530 [Ladona fulva]
MAVFAMTRENREQHPKDEILQYRMDRYIDRETAERLGSEPSVNTALAAFFQLCQNDPIARTCLHADVPLYYTWNATSRIFQRRKQGTPVEDHEGIFKSDALGRMNKVH